MLSIREISDKKYELIITEKDKVVYRKDIDWAEMAHLFCQVATQVCREINKEE